MLKPITKNLEFKKHVAFEILLLASVLVGVTLLWYVRFIVLLVIAGGIGALVLASLTDYVSNIVKLRRGISFAIVLTLLLICLSLAVWLRGPQTIRDISDLQASIPNTIHRLDMKVQESNWGPWILNEHTAGTATPGLATNALELFRKMLTNTVSAFVDLFVVAVVAIYVAVEPNYYVAALHRLTPKQYWLRMDLGIEGAIQMLRSWLLAKFVSMFAIGLFIASGLWALGVPMAGTLGIIAAVLTFVPNIGAVLSFLPAMLLAFSISSEKGCLTILLFCLAHILEGNLITPLADKTLVRLSPALTLVVQLLMFSIGGILGVLVAAPLLAATIGVLNILLPSEEVPVNEERKLAITL